MPEGGVDIVVVDGGISEVAAAQVVQEARALRPAPFVVLCGGKGAARPPGVDGLLPRPASPEDARHLANLCVRACLPKRVLIVDDSATMRSIVRKILSGSRFRLEIERRDRAVARARRSFRASLRRLQHAGL
jgi:hypothetical protein